jgi:hypothetical protein
MSFDVKMSSDASRSLTNSSGKLQSTKSSPAAISQLGELAGLVDEVVWWADVGNMRAQVSHAQFGSAWRVIPVPIV